MSSKYINEYVFHYNKFNETWSAIPRELYREYWNDFSDERILRSRSIETLIEGLDRLGRINRIVDVVPKV